MLVSPPCTSEADRYSLEALQNIHQMMDDDKDGGIEVEESVEVGASESSLKLCDTFIWVLNVLRYLCKQKLDRVKFSNRCDDQFQSWVILQGQEQYKYTLGSLTNVVSLTGLPTSFNGTWEPFGNIKKVVGFTGKWKRHLQYIDQLYWILFKISSFVCYVILLLYFKPETTAQKCIVLSTQKCMHM